jgi:multimeric flavodoxin WrbA
MIMILGICGSLRDISNTNRLVKKAAEASGEEFDLVYLAGKTIKPCTGCSTCMMNEGKCSIDDDMTEINEKIINADAIIMGGPTYFMDINGALKDVIDRSSATFYREIGPEYKEGMPWLGQRPMAGKPAVIITTVAGGGHERAIETLRVCVEEIYQMKIVSKLAEAIRMDDVDDLPDVLKRAEEAGKKLGEVLKG